MNRSSYYRSNCQNTLWTLIYCTPKFVILDNTRRNGQLIFFTGKIAFLFKNLCFQQPLKCHRNDLTTSTVFFRIPVATLQVVHLGLSHSITRETIGQNLFFAGKFAFFSKHCVFSNLLGVKQLML